MAGTPFVPRRQEPKNSEASRTQGSRPVPEEAPVILSSIRRARPPASSARRWRLKLRHQSRLFRSRPRIAVWPLAFWNRISEPPFVPIACQSGPGLALTTPLLIKWDPIISQIAIRPSAFCNRTSAWWSGQSLQVNRVGEFGGSVILRRLRRIGAPDVPSPRDDQPY